MRVLYGNEFKQNPLIKEAFYFFIEEKCLQHFKWQNGKEVFLEYPYQKESPESIIKRRLNLGWEEITNLRQFLTHPHAEVRNEVKRKLK